MVGGDGNLGLVGLGRRFGGQIDGTGSEVNLVAVFYDTEYANKGFGIDAMQAAASGLEAPKLSGGLHSIGADYSYRSFFGKLILIICTAHFHGRARLDNC